MVYFTGSSQLTMRKRVFQWKLGLEDGQHASQHHTADERWGWKPSPGHLTPSLAQKVPDQTGLL